LSKYNSQLANQTSCKWFDINFIVAALIHERVPHMYAKLLVESSHLLIIRFVTWRHLTSRCTESYWQQNRIKYNFCAYGSSELNHIKSLEYRDFLIEDMPCRLCVIVCAPLLSTFGCWVSHSITRAEIFVEHQPEAHNDGANKATNHWTNRQGCST